MARILILTPDLDWPIGGVKVHYQVVDALNAAGIDAAIVHAKKGFRCSWFQNRTKVVSRSETDLLASDLVVIPEEWAHFIGELPADVKKVVFNQNAYTTFGWGVSADEVRSAYARSDLLRVVAISDNNAAYLRYAFPQIEVRRSRQVIDFDRFRHAAEKQRIISYMPRKRAMESSEVLALLKSRDALKGWEVVPIEGMTESQTADVMRASSIFLSFSYREGCPLPPAEAMACGCIVIGFHGWGGAEISDEACWVADGDILSCARMIESVSGSFDDPVWREKSARIAAHIERNYNQKQFDASVIAAFEYTPGGYGGTSLGRISEKFWVGNPSKATDNLRHAARHLRSAARIMLKGR